MRNFNRLILLFLVSLCSLLPQARALDVITATLTVTNLATNGHTISVNGYVRTWTNNVAAANVQITTATNIAGTATNLFQAYAAFPAVQVFTRQTASNVVQFQSYPGYFATVEAASNWASVSYTTNTLTAATVVRVPPAAVGDNERTNVSSGLIAYIGSDAPTNAVPVTAPAFAAFIPPDISGITNFALMLSTNGTNFTLWVGLELTNKVDALGTAISNVIDLLDTAAFQPVEAFQPACSTLSNLCDLGTIQGLSYIEAGTGNILLSNTNATERLRANEGGDFTLNFEDGTAWCQADTSHNVNLKDDGGVARVEIDDSATSAGRTVLRSDNNVDSLVVDGSSDVIKTYKGVAFHQNTMPAVAIGTATNYLADAVNSGNSDTDANSFTIPANTLDHDGDTVVRIVGVELAANGNSKKVQISFNANPVMTVAGVTLSGGFIYCKVVVTRDSSSSYRYAGTGTTGASTPGTAGNAYASAGSAAGVDFTNPITFKLILTGTSSSDLTVVLDRIEFGPSHDYAF